MRWDFLKQCDGQGLIPHIHSNTTPVTDMTYEQQERYFYKCVVKSLGGVLLKICKGNTSAMNCLFGTETFSRPD